MSSRPWICATIALGLCAIGTPTPILGASGPASQADATPTLQIASVPGYDIAVKGTGWHPGSRLTLSAAEGYFIQGVEFRSSKVGAFVVGVKGNIYCWGVLFEGRDFASHQVSLQVPPRGGPGQACGVPK